MKHEIRDKFFSLHFSKCYCVGFRRRLVCLELEIDLPLTVSSKASCWCLDIVSLELLIGLHEIQIPPSQTQKSQLVLADLDFRGFSRQQECAHPLCLFSSGHFWMQVGHLSCVSVAGTAVHFAQPFNGITQLWSCGLEKSSLNYSALISLSTFSLNDVIENKVVEGTLIPFVNLILKILEFPALAYWFDHGSLDCLLYLGRWQVSFKVSQHKMRHNSVLKTCEMK